MMYLFIRIVFVLLFKHTYYLGSESYSREQEKLPNIVIHSYENITEKAWPVNLDVIIYVATHYAKKVK